MPRTLPSLGKQVDWILHQGQNPARSGLAGQLLWVFDALLSTAILAKISCIFFLCLVLI
jgi:hypothetical protein